MFFVLGPFACVACSTVRCESSFSVTHVVSPLALVSVLLATEKFSVAMAFVSFPLSNIELVIVIVAVAVALADVVSPFSVVLVVGPLLLVGAVEDALAITNVSSLYQHVPIVMVSIPVRVPSVNSARNVSLD